MLPQVSPDGKWVIYRSMQGISSWTLMRIPIEGGKPEPVPTAGKLEEFRCPLRAGTPCVLRTVENGQFVFNELDPVRGEGRELARTDWSPTIRGDWDVSPDLQGRSTDLLESANPIFAVPSPDGRHVAFPQPRAWSNAWLFQGL
ncbi:MAG: hypothetical protein ACRD2G_15950 [Terriglobia bacterium]